MRTLLTVMLLSFAAAPLQAQETLRPEDTARLNRFDATLGAALLNAFAQGTPEDIITLVRALSGVPQLAFHETLAGDWTCRTIKLGGTDALIAYAPFKCRFTFQGNSYLFEKLSGSQRTKGTISIREGRAIYVGVGHAATQTPPNYTDLAADFRATPEIQTDVARFERVSPSRARLLFPAPHAESDFDILELTR